MDGGAEDVVGIGRVSDAEEEVCWLDTEPLVAEFAGRAEAVGETGKSKPDDAVVPLLCFCVRDWGIEAVVGGGAAVELARGEGGEFDDATGRVSGIESFPVRACCRKALA